MGRRDERRSEAAKAWRKLYRTAAWLALRAAQLAAHPLCSRCLQRGFTVAATVANHIIPHRGDLVLFFDPGNLESVCKPCHDGRIQSEERRGFSDEIGPDGFPVDPRHPANRPPGA